MEIKICRVCNLELNETNSYIKHSTNLLCKKHHHELQNSSKRKRGYLEMKRYEKKNDKTEKRKKQFAETAKRMYEKYPEKWRARSKVSYAIRTGKIVKPDKCSNCHKVKQKLEAHHDDYIKPLNVRWLCIQCHNQHHHQEQNIQVFSPLTPPTRI